MNNIIGAIIFIVMSVPKGYHYADGTCMQFKEYRELAEILHDKDDWPYGLCEGGFKLPDLRPKNWKDGDPIAIIKVK